MRIAHVITRLILGGAQENTVASVAGLRRCPGLEVELISGPTGAGEGSLVPWVRREGISLTETPHLVRPVHPLRDLLAWRWLTAHFRRTRPDVVHTHSGKAGVLGRLAARRAGVPLVVHTIHGPSFGPFQGACANAVFTAAERRAGRCTDRFVSVADAMTAQYLAAGIGGPSQYATVRSGFDLEPFLKVPLAPDPARRKALGLAGGDFVIGCIARLAPLKGHEDLVRLLPRLVGACPATRVLLVGDGPLRARLETALASAGLAGRVVFAGLVPPGDVAAHLAAMDALVHLSYREGLPRALPQALAAGRPVVAYDCDGAREVCRDGETGFLVPLGDGVGAADALARLGQDPALRIRLGRAGRELVRDAFSVERMVSSLEQLYRRWWTEVAGRGAGHNPT